MYILEAGINHFGDKKEAEYLFKNFLKSDAKKITFMIHTQKFYDSFKSKINFKLSFEFYKSLLFEAHQHGKQVGLSVCDLETAAEIKNLNFDFYKLLSISIKNNKLIRYLDLKNKPVYISTGIASDRDINNCIKKFSKKKNLFLLHTPMSYDSSELNLRRIKYLKEKFKIKCGYSHHYKDSKPLSTILPLDPDCIFIYMKGKKKRGRSFPDDRHALFFDELQKLFKKGINIMEMLGSGDKANKKIKIFDQIKIKK
tara:strand:- start:259 stop:1023 length:765 start_codon:yes stop_codon:yes gene_type:complete